MADGWSRIDEIAARVLARMERERANAARREWVGRSVCIIHDTGPRCEAAGNAANDNRRNARTAHGGGADRPGCAACPGGK